MSSFADSPLHLQGLPPEILSFIIENVDERNNDPFLDQDYEASESLKSLRLVSENNDLFASKQLFKRYTIRHSKFRTHQNAITEIAHDPSLAQHLQRLAFELKPNEWVLIYQLRPGPKFTKLDLSLLPSLQIIKQPYVIVIKSRGRRDNVDVQPPPNTILLPLLPAGLPTVETVRFWGQTEPNRSYLRANWTNWSDPKTEPITNGSTVS